MIRDTSRRSTPSRQQARQAPALLAGLIASLVAAMLAGAAQAAPTTGPSTLTDSALARTLAAKPTSGWKGVILKTASPLTPTQEGKIRALGGDITCRLPLIGSVAVRVPSRSLRAVAALPFITHLSLDGTVQKSDDFTVGSSEANQAYAMNGSGGQYQLTGQGVTVAILDSGVAPVQDLSNNDLGLLSRTRIRASVNFAPDATGHGSAYGGGVGVTLDLSNSRSQGLSLTGLGTSLTLLGPGNDGSLYDPCGHGTHIAGIIAGDGARSDKSFCFHTFNGIAPKAGLANVRVLDNNGQANVATVISGLQWVVAHRNDNANAPIRVINLSLGHPVDESYTTDPLCQAVEAAYRAGIVVVCAAGNNGRFGAANLPGASNEGWGTAYGSIQSPANDPYIITVGATKSTDGSRWHDKIATYSSRGPSRVDLVLKPDIIAPGNKVVSLCSDNSMLDTYAGGTNDILKSAYERPGLLSSQDGSSFAYFRLSGTSMAAPVVAGAAALMLQADPTLTPDTIKARLMLSADKWADPNGAGDALTYGAGYLDIPAALASTARAYLPALSPTLTINSDGTLSLVMDRAAWGSGLWGTGITDLRAAWGSSVGADRAAWGSTTNANGSVSLFMDRATWGSSALIADRAAWGSTATSADRAAWGSGLAAADRAAWGSRATWGSSSPAVDLTSTAVKGE